MEEKLSMHKTQNGSLFKKGEIWPSIWVWYLVTNQSISYCFSSL